MIVADELEADWARVRVVQSPGDEKTYGNQDTDGSRSVRHFIQPMRAVRRRDARRCWRPAAAKRWGVDVGEVAGAAATRSCTSRRAASSATASSPPMRRHCRCPPADKLKLKEPSAFRYIGKGNVRIVDLFDITTGKRHLRPGRRAARHEVRRHRPAAGGRRQGRVVRLRREP